jgi:protein-S-isoprenylcysteine O-methyltransferase Ste14
MFRHPTYSATFLFFRGLPLALGSRWGLVAAPVFMLLSSQFVLSSRSASWPQACRIMDYAARVRYRLVPEIW